MLHCKLTSSVCIFLRSSSAFCLDCRSSEKTCKLFWNKCRCPLVYTKLIFLWGHYLTKNTIPQKRNMKLQADDMIRQISMIMMNLPKPNFIVLCLIYIEIYKSTLLQQLHDLLTTRYSNNRFVTLPKPPTNIAKRYTNELVEFS